MSRKIIEKHIKRVQDYLHIFQKLLYQNGQEHDASKLEDTELPYFEKYSELLKTCTYGSPEYKKYLQDLAPALEHHYGNNRHHPEHFVKYVCNGCFSVYQEVMPNICKVCGYSQFQKESDISQMNLFDLCEMFCDWIAASEQHENGDILKSIEINKERFGYDDLVKAILTNTAKRLTQESKT